MKVRVFIFCPALNLTLGILQYSYIPLHASVDAEYIYTNSDGIFSFIYFTKVLKLNSCFRRITWIARLLALVFQTSAAIRKRGCRLSSTHMPSSYFPTLGDTVNLLISVKSVVVLLFEMTPIAGQLPSGFFCHNSSPRNGLFPHCLSGLCQDPVTNLSRFANSCVIHNVINLLHEMS